MGSHKPMLPGASLKNWKQMLTSNMPGKGPLTPSPGGKRTHITPGQHLSSFKALQTADTGWHAGGGGGLASAAVARKDRKTIELKLKCMAIAEIKRAVEEIEEEAVRTDVM